MGRARRGFFKQICTSGKGERCGSDFCDDSGTKWEILSATVQHGDCHAREDGVEGDVDGELELFLGRCTEAVRDLPYTMKALVAMRSLETVSFRHWQYEKTSFLSYFARHVGAWRFLSRSSAVSESALLREKGKPRELNKHFKGTLGTLTSIICFLGEHAEIWNG